jgi:hypothetical protein
MWRIRSKMRGGEGYQRSDISDQEAGEEEVQELKVES